MFAVLNRHRNKIREISHDGRTTPAASNRDQKYIQNGGIHLAPPIPFTHFVHLDLHAVVRGKPERSSVLRTYP